MSDSKKPVDTMQLIYALDDLNPGDLLRGEMSDAADAVKEAEAAMKAAIKRRDFATEKVKKIHADHAKLTFGQIKKLAESKLTDATLLSLLKKVKQGWEKYRRDGADDGQILLALKTGFPRNQYSSQGNRAEGGDAAKVWIDAPGWNAKPTFEGKTLVAEVRRLLEIPTPKQPATPPAKKPTAAKPAAKKPAPKKKPAKKGGGGGGSPATKPSSSDAIDPDLTAGIDDGKEDPDASAAAADGLSDTIESGETYTPAQLGGGLSAETLEEAMPPQPGGLYGDHLGKQPGGRIGFPLTLGDDFDWAVVGCRQHNHGGSSSAKSTYALIPAFDPEEWTGAKVPWAKRREANAKVAPEEIPLKGMIVLDPGGRKWVLGKDAEVIYCEVDRPATQAAAPVEELDIPTTPAGPKNKLTVLLRQEAGNWLSGWSCTIAAPDGGRSGVSGIVDGKPFPVRADAIRDAIERMARWFNAPSHKPELRAGLQAALKDLLDFVANDPALKRVATDPRVNADGVFANPTRHSIQLTNTQSAKVLTDVGVDKLWRCGFAVDWKLAQLVGANQPVRLDGKTYPTQGEAKIAGVDQLIHYVGTTLADGAIWLNKASVAALRASLAALHEFRKQLDAETKERPTFAQWMAHFRDALPEDATYNAGDPKIFEHYEAGIPAKDAAAAFLRGAGPQAVQLPIIIPKPHEAGQKQTFGQWVASFNSSLSARGLRCNVMTLLEAQGDAELVGLYAAGYPASKAAGLIRTRPDPAPRKTNGAAHPNDPAALAVGYSSHAAAGTPAERGHVQ